MTHWDPYPSSPQAAAAPTPGRPTVTYEPYPTAPVEYTPGYSAAVAPYDPIRDPYFSAPARPSVKPAEAVKLAVKNWNNYSGRASRSEFWWPALAALVVNAMIRSASEGMITFASTHGAPLVAGGITTLLSLMTLALLIPLLSLAVRRLHDTGRRGIMVLVGLIPLVGPLALAWLLSRQADPSGAVYDRSTTAPFGPEDL